MPGKPKDNLHQKFLFRAAIREDRRTEVFEKPDSTEKSNLSEISSVKTSINAVTVV